MDSKNKRTQTESSGPKILSLILERLRPLLLTRWRRSSREARDAAARAGVQDVEAFMAGFQQGYWKGAVDVSQERLSSSDLKTPEPQKNSLGSSRVLVMTKTKAR